VGDEDNGERGKEVGALEIKDINYLSFTMQLRDDQ